MNTLVILLIAIILGYAVAWLCGLFLPHTFALLIGAAVGVIWFVRHDDGGRL